MVAHQEDPGRIRAIVRQVRARRMLARATAGLPVGEAGRTLLGEGAPWFESWLEHPEHDDPFWTPLQLHAALDRTEIPVLLIGGWQDVFIEQTLAQYAHLRRRGVPVAVTIGSWNHSHMQGKGAPTVLRESLAWLDTHLAGNHGERRSPVRIHVNHKGWIDLDDWPPAMPEQVRYLQPGGRLGDAVPPDTAPASTFTYDPAAPDTNRRRSPAVAGGRLPQRRQAGGARRRAELHRGRAGSRTSMSSEIRSSNCRTRATTLTTTCSFGSARWIAREPPAMSATDITAAQQLRAPCALNWMRSRTGSARDHASGCWSPVDRIRGSSATSAPASPSAPAADCGRPRTPCTSETARRACCCPRGRGLPSDRLNRAPGSAISCSVASSCTGAAQCGIDRDRHPALTARVVRQRGAAAPARPADSPARPTP